MNRLQLRAFAMGLFGTSLLSLIGVLWNTTPIEGEVVEAAQPVSAMVASPIAELEEEATLSAPAEVWTEHKIRSGESLGRILPVYGAPVQAVLAAAKPITDLSTIRAGQALGFRYEGASKVPSVIRYSLDQDRTLLVERTAAVGPEEADTWTARVDEVLYERRLGVREFEVESTLWGAAVAAGMRPADIASLARVFEFDIDFNTEIQKGARVRVVIEELWNEGELARLGTPEAARLENSGKSYVALRHLSADGTSGYYDEKGISRRTAFLRSPIAFARVTSSFNLKRFHPVLKKSRPHYGVDFGAPTGTPVRAVGDGTVTVSGRNGGHGNFVKLDHSGPYETSYSHLSKIAVRRGQKVRQGQVIGYVGSTGMSTGPHLHYQLWVNGKYKNPMTVEMARNEELSKSEMGRFQQTRDRWLAVLDGAPLPVEDGYEDPYGEVVDDPSGALADAQSQD